MKKILTFAFLISFSNLYVAQTIYETSYEDFIKAYKYKDSCPYNSNDIGNFFQTHYSQYDLDNFWNNEEIEDKKKDSRYNAALQNLERLLENPKGKFLFSSKEKSYVTAVLARAQTYNYGKEYEKALQDFLEVWNSDKKCWKRTAANNSAFIYLNQGKFYESNLIFKNFYRAWSDGEHKHFKYEFKQSGVKYPLTLSEVIANNYLKQGKFKEAENLFNEILTYEDEINSKYCQVMIDSKIGKGIASSEGNLSNFDIYQKIGNGIEPFKKESKQLNKLLPFKQSEFKEALKNVSKFPTKGRFEKESEYQERISSLDKNEKLKKEDLFIYKLSPPSYDVEKEIITFYLDEYIYLDFKALEVENYSAQNAFNAKREVMITKSEQNRLVVRNFNNFLNRANYGYQPIKNYSQLQNKKEENRIRYYGLEKLQFPLSVSMAEEIFDSLSVYLIFKHSFEVDNYKDEPTPTYDQPNRFWKKGKSLDVEISHVVLFDESKKEIVNYLSPSFTNEDFNPCQISESLDDVLKVSS